MNTPRVKEILGWYGSDNPGTLTHLARLLKLEEIRGIHEGGGFGSIIGRNSFQRKKEHALQLLGQIMEIYGAPKR